ncbi:MAG: helix-turn-helix transcriptional regulator, partial [Candidatus Eremiobacteraeota bacterium]|nr:helix-turn-helix transcriptional regulator [Candidatus Eremiobacteraeota bacterium]
YEKEAERLLRSAYETYDAIAYDWRAGRVALALAEIAPDSSWHALAEAKLRLYPASWLAKKLVRTTRSNTMQPSGDTLRSATTQDVGRLTAAQTEVYRLLLRGLTTAEIATERGSSESTIRNHIKVIFKVFRVRSRPALLAAASVLGADT